MSDLIRRLERRPVTPRADRVRFEGRVLHLVDDAGAIRRQLAGEDLPRDHGIAYRDDISTDEITPAWVCYYFDETLGDFPYVGYRAGGEFPIGRNDVKKGGFAVAVSGKRRGKGSSREASPYAEKCAGIRLVVAENIERIYQQNCHNLGLLTTTDFSVLDRVLAGEEISRSPSRSSSPGRIPSPGRSSSGAGSSSSTSRGCRGRSSSLLPAPRREG
jgi:3-isopropylmalate/(R)-2-methylmalate dehydratase large subunit